MHCFKQNKYYDFDYLLESYLSFEHTNNCKELMVYRGVPCILELKKIFVVPGSVFALDPSLYRRTYS